LDETIWSPKRKKGKRISGSKIFRGKKKKKDFVEQKERRSGERVNQATGRGGGHIQASATKKFVWTWEKRDKKSQHIVRGGQR